MEIIGSKGAATDRKFMFSNPGNGNSFYGYVRNLRVYGSSGEPKDVAALYQQIKGATAAAGSK